MQIELGILYTSWQIEGEKVEVVIDFIFLGSNIITDGDLSHKIKRCFLLGRKAMRNLDSMLKSRHLFAHNGLYSQSYGFSSSHVWMWELDHKEGCTPNNWCFQIVLEETLESLLDCKEIKPMNPKRNQPWIFIERTDAEAEAPMFWPPDVKSQLTGKYSDAGKERRQKEKRVTEDEMVSWHDCSMGINLTNSRR